MDDTDADGAEEDDPFDEADCEDGFEDTEESADEPRTESDDPAERELKHQQGVIKGMCYMLEHEIEPGTHRERFARQMLEVEQQKLVALQLKGSTGASTKGSTEASTRASTEASTRASTDGSGKTSEVSMPRRQGPKTQRKREGRKNLKRAA